MRKTNDDADIIKTKNRPLLFIKTAIQGVLSEFTQSDISRR